MRLTNLVLYMLKSFRPYLLVVILSLVFTTVFVDQALCQPPPPPPGGATGTGGHNLNANQGGAPLGEGIWILITLAFSYGLHSYMKRRENAGTESVQDKLVSASHDNSTYERHDTGLKTFFNEKFQFLLHRILKKHMS